MISESEARKVQRAEQGELAFCALHLKELGYNSMSTLSLLPARDVDAGGFFPNTRLDVRPHPAVDFNLRAGTLILGLSCSRWQQTSISHGKLLFIPLVDL